MPFSSVAFPKQASNKGPVPLCVDLSIQLGPIIRYLTVIRRGCAVRKRWGWWVMLGWGRGRGHGESIP